MCDLGARSLGEAHDASGLELREARAAREAAQAEAQRLTRQFDSALEELRQEHVSTLQQQAVARTALPLDELLTVFGALASASTPSAVLTNVPPLTFAATFRTTVSKSIVTDSVTLGSLFTNTLPLPSTAATSQARW